MNTPPLFRFEAVGPASLLESAYALAVGEPQIGLSASLFEHGDERTRRLELIFDAMPDHDGVLSALGLLGSDVQTAVGVLTPQDWVALSLEGLAPIEAGRFRLHGSHDEPRKGGGTDLLIEAGEAFGTGHHGTTLGCLIALHDLLKRGAPRSTLDVGTGTGALALAVALNTRRPALATDIDPIAVRVAQENVVANGATGLVGVIEADGLKSPALRGRRFDLVIANILAGPLQVLAGDLIRATEHGGVIVLSGLLQPQSRGVLAAYTSRGARLVRRYNLDGWATLVLTRP